MQPDLYTVIGGGGFVGSRLALFLRAAGHAVFVPLRDDPRLFTQPLGRVLYCAGLTADFAARPFDTVQAHVSLLARVLQESDFVHLVYLSSTRLYDSLGENHGNLAEESLPLLLDVDEPRHLYDLSKALGENLCLTTAGNRAAVARLSNVYDWQKDAPGFLSVWLQRASVQKSLELDSAGGVAVFLGTTRAEKHPDGRELVALEYEAYEPMALDQLKKLAAAARQRWPIIKLAILHRTGEVALAEPSVVIAVSTPHRGDATLFWDESNWQAMSKAHHDAKTAREVNGRREQ